MSISQNEKPTIFITYDWNETSDLFIDDLKKTITGVTFIIDKKNVSSWDSLTQFMNTIKEQDFVIQLLSDKYLKSPNCLYEVVQLMDCDNWQSKTMTVVLKDAEGIYEYDKKIEYVEYWCNKVKELEDRINKLPPAATKSLKDELSKYEVIRDRIGDFLVIASDRLNPKLSDALDAIQRRIPSSHSTAANESQSSVAMLVLPKEKESIAQIWEQVVPLVHKMLYTCDDMHDSNKIEELKLLRDKTHQLAILLESRKLYISQNVYGRIDNFVTQICRFYDGAVWICSLNRTTQFVHGLAKERYSNQITLYNTSVNKMREYISKEYDSLMNDVIK